MTVALLGAGKGSPGPGVTTLPDTFRGTDQNNSALTTYTFNNKDIGAADARRRVVVAMYSRGGTAHVHDVGASLTGNPGAIAFTFIGTAPLAAADVTPHVSLWNAAVPTGAQIDFSFTLAAAPAACGLCWMTHGRTAASSFAIDTSSPYDQSLTVANDGFVFAAFVNGSSTALTFTWGGGLVEQFNISAANYTRAAAMYSHVGAGASMPFSIVPSGGTPNRFIVAAFGAAVP